MASQSAEQAATVHQPRWLVSMAACVLWLAVVCSALAVVYSTHKARQLTNQLAKAQAESADLQVVRGQYLLERSALGAYSRVETMAVDKLHMQPPAAEAIVVVEQ
ncbi:cell division protein FtsL [Halioxenophilus aromaticivorans]|uniref:Cell division protein FtsL n=1 Tax=Halioxenophilus aromaticivorans TaxID=1306992 RepID=A0AAV3TYI7_9ALTE